MIIQFDDLDRDDIITLDVVSGGKFSQITGRFIEVERWYTKPKYRVAMMVARISPRGRRYEEQTHIPTCHIKRIQREAVKS